ncbi:antichymotrypsin-2-like [Choristoneura fumiferana]|uniref:antichymotrypsin-2-like n=1 Tax=Choristoneura fumiferana TaxID=7141 RepID=UPI003D159961
MDQKTLVRPFIKFAVDFCNELESKTSVCSPVSAEITLALVALGSTNKTHEELLEALGFPNDDAIRTTFSYLTSNLKDLKETLKVATKVCLKKGDYELKDLIRKDAEAVFEADLEQLDFGDGEAAANHINNWAAVQTNDKIKHIISANEFSDAQILLLNAIYFKGAWLKPFKRHLTEDRDFHVNKQTNIKVPMMTVTDKFRNGRIEDLKVQILELQYTKEDASMVIVLPDEVEGLQKVLKQLTAGHDLMADIEGLNAGSKPVQVSMPKFKIETTVDLKKVLPKLNIKMIFDKNMAEINLMRTPQRFCVSGAIQKAFIDVNEEGTEAAAVTKMKLSKRKGTYPTFFTADHPFLFLLICQHIPFFIGIYRGDEA